MSDAEKTRGRIIIAIFIGLAVVTVGGTIISNFVMWRNYDTIETERGLTAEDAEPLPKEVNLLPTQP